MNFPGIYFHSARRYEKRSSLSASVMLRTIIILLRPSPTTISDISTLMLILTRSTVKKPG